ncbi:hypothetical protein PILCRDRAFT_828320 [Piloderma croceum F 1598]|uniref:Uncharacterized protein n=1 Tax=Piloderma croceum (strain F 1598) TaxID=765440 RepID=A0A0C3F2M4_PILCF|nr:hypothetical protein PILCRDRAFT_828320 [Piloderma croceum F 1598]
MLMSDEEQPRDQAANTRIKMKRPVVVSSLWRHDAIMRRGATVSRQQCEGRFAPLTTYCICSTSA